MVLSFLVISAFLLLPVLLSLYHIVGFHLLLSHYGMTTYDYIVARHREVRMNAAVKRSSMSSEDGEGSAAAKALSSSITSSSVREISV